MFNTHYMICIFLSYLTYDLSILFNLLKFIEICIVHVFFSCLAPILVTVTLILLYK